GAPPRRQSAPATGAPAQLRKQPTARPRPQAPRAENASGPSVAVAPRSQAPASSRSPKRASIHPSKPPKASSRTLHHPPRTTRSTPVLPPITATETTAGARSPGTTQTDNLPTLPSVP